MSKEYFENWWREFGTWCDNPFTSKKDTSFEAYEAGIAEGRKHQWQPIETAPRDGSHVQLYRPKIQFVGYYGGSDSGWRINAQGLPAMWPLPTHWMPLPEAPK